MDALSILLVLIIAVFIVFGGVSLYAIAKAGSKRDSFMDKPMGRPENVHPPDKRASDNELKWW